MNILMSTIDWDMILWNLHLMMVISSQTFYYIVNARTISSNAYIRTTTKQAGEFMSRNHPIIKHLIIIISMLVIKYKYVKQEPFKENTFVNYPKYFYHILNNYQKTNNKIITIRNYFNIKIIIYIKIYLKIYKYIIIY